MHSPETSHPVVKHGTGRAADLLRSGPHPARGHSQRCCGPLPNRHQPRPGTGADLGFRVAGPGFEPGKAEPTVLQTAPFGRSGNLPLAAHMDGTVKDSGRSGFSSHRHSGRHQRSSTSHPCSGNLAARTAPGHRDAAAPRRGPPPRRSPRPAGAPHVGAAHQPPPSRNAARPPGCRRDPAAPSSLSPDIQRSSPLAHRQTGEPDRRGGRRWPANPASTS